MKLGVFGGTFDPVHQGHLILAEEALYHLSLDRVIWVLTPNPPHKISQPILSWEKRLQMLTLAVAGNAGFEISNVDILRKPPHYAVDTIKLLKEQYLGDQLILLMGSDSLMDLPLWYQPRELIHVSDGLGIMGRPGVTINLDWLEEQIPGICQKLLYLSTPYVEISSSDIRQRITSGKPYRYFVPPAVYDHIEQHRLYLL